MALIKCPECKKKISDQCGNCPHCGYPIQDYVQQERSDSPVDLSEQPKKAYNKALVWIVVSVALAAIIIGVIFLLAHNTKPKLDKEGNPVFAELTTEVYTNAKEYKGYHINIKGQVFQVMNDNGNTKGIQIWLDPDTCEQNVMIYYNTDVTVKQGDYIVCSGYIDSVVKYENAYGATMYAPLVMSSDLRQSTYIEVMAPTTATITPENLTYKKYGYSLSVDKIEFSEKETRIYVTAKNNGTAKLYFEDAVIIQNGNQFTETSNFEANYIELPREVSKGASCSGILVFPVFPVNEFELSFDIYSDNHEEQFNNFIFMIAKDTANIVDYGYETAVQTMIDLYNGELEDAKKVLPQELWVSISNEFNLTIAAVQEDIEYWYSYGIFDAMVQSFTISSTKQLTKTQREDFLSGTTYRYDRYNLHISSILDGYELKVDLISSNGEHATLYPTIIRIGDNWYWTTTGGTNYPAFATGPITPAV